LAVNLNTVTGSPTKTTSANVVTVDGGHFCEAKGVIAPQLHFDLRLPTSTWRGQYVQEGCGGYCGVVAPGQPLASTSCPAVTGNQLALATDNEGHVSSSVNRASWASENPELTITFGYGSEHDLALASKALILSYYGHPPLYSYFDGCSDGGREALVEAQRYPDDFNGILAGAPAAFESELNAEFQPWLIAANTNSSGRETLTSAKLPALHAAVVKACGGPNGYVVDPRSCSFNPSSLECPFGKDSNACLTPQQVKTVTAFYRGPSDSQGQSLYPGGEPYGSELAWSSWMIDASEDRAWPFDTLAYKYASNYLRYLADPTKPLPSLSLSQFHFDLQNYRQATALAGLYDSTDPNLSGFSRAHGKLILYQGWADQAVPPFGTVSYYAEVNSEMGGFDATQAFSRLYMVPAQYHCLDGGDPHVSSDLLTPLMNWVQHSIAPTVISFPLLKPTSKMERIPVSPLDPLVPVREGLSALNANYDWVGTLSSQGETCSTTGGALTCT
jgi:feruloyl esterase